MLAWALVFLIVALAAAPLGFGGIAGTAAVIAKVLTIMSLVLFGLGVLMHLRGGGDRHLDDGPTRQRVGTVEHDRQIYGDYSDET